MIPKILHMIWVGDETKRPNRCIQSWIHHHPDWTIRVWGNQELLDRQWINQEHLLSMSRREWNGVADMMRWEILFSEGGVLVDADSVCLRPLPEWLLECEAFACWENELLRPGLIAAGYIGSVPTSKFMAFLIHEIKQQPTVTDRMAWESVGPHLLTETWKKYQYHNLTILPSHFFIPQHFSGAEYSGGGPVYAQQEWGSTLRRYDDLASETLEVLAQVGAMELEEPGETFLFEPDWSGTEWVGVLLSYLTAFVPEDPVSLLFILDPTQGSPLSMEQAERAVLDLMARTGKERTPEVILIDQPHELPDFLRKRPRLSWVPDADTEDLGGKFRTRFAKVRQQMKAGLS